MIDVYAWMTPNGFKITIALEELGIPYVLKPVNISQGENKEKSFTEMAPNQKTPVIVDHSPKRGGPLTLSESGAILLYLAEKKGALFPKSGAGRAEVYQWLMFQMSAVGPSFGQAFHFQKATAEKLPYSLKRFMGETKRLCYVLDQHLATRDYLAKTYSIADIATYPWIRSLDPLGVSLGDYLHLKRWYHMIDARPNVQKGMSVFKVLGLPAKALVKDAAQPLKAQKEGPTEPLHSVKDPKPAKQTDLRKPTKEEIQCAKDFFAKKTS